MARVRSRIIETESINPRTMRRGAVKRQHLSRWAVGRDELAPGVVGDTHLDPSALERIREVAVGEGVGQLLIVSATRQSFASGGDYVSADSTVYQFGFDGATADAVVWPVDAAGEIQVEFAWDTYDGGGTIEIEVNGTVPAWGLLASGSSGRTGCKRRSVHIAEGSVVKVRVTQTSGVAQTADVVVEFSIPDPSAHDDNPVFLESFWVDSKVSGGGSSTFVLNAGASYQLVVVGNARGADGTFSFGAPDTILYPSPGETAEPAQADAEVTYASTVDTPLPTHRNTSEFSFQFNTGAGWAHLEPVGGPFSAPTTEHSYTYLVTGADSTVGVRYLDLPAAYDDNNGMFRVDVYRVVSG
jgi:hypothetical protein